MLFLLCLWESTLTACYAFFLYHSKRTLNDEKWRCYIKHCTAVSLFAISEIALLVLLASIFIETHCSVLSLFQVQDGCQFQVRKLHTKLMKMLIFLVLQLLPTFDAHPFTHILLLQPISWVADFFSGGQLVFHWRICSTTYNYYIAYTCTFSSGCSNVLCIETTNDSY